MRGKQRTSARDRRRALHARRLERRLHVLHRGLGARLLRARENVADGGLRLRPRVHRDVAFGEQGDGGHALCLFVGGDFVFRWQFL